MKNINISPGEQPPAGSPLELWAGLESTVNRVGDRYFDQLVLSGHDERISDLDLFAELGITAIRYPVIWERIAPSGLETASWAWSDERLSRLRELSIRPIAGLVHHGSGPPDTSLVDPAFPLKLAAYARAVAERYPWLDAYTPVNEILTTARFSGLYGHWYPHRRSPEDFKIALFNQVRGVQLAMRAIREVNPAAQLVQTDDMGKVYSSPQLGYQAEFENERRWLAYDLLTGRVDRHHPLFAFLLWSGANEGELEEIQALGLQPDVMGINYYITSERFLDERLEHYPPEMHGGNGREAYVDTEAARVCQSEMIGYGGILREAWQRYGLPLAATEVHLGGHREQQIRWWMEAWTAVNALRNEGVDVRAMTAWSLLGAFHWDNLVTSEEGSYETGLFDVRSSQPRPTLLAKLIQSLAQTGQFDHPLLDEPGWWHMPDRMLYPPPDCQPGEESPSPQLLSHIGARGEEQESPTSSLPVHRSRGQGPGEGERHAPRPVLITGAGGTLGQAFQRLCSARDIAFHALHHHELDIADRASIEQVLREIRPWAIINAAGYVRVDDAEFEPEVCRRINTLGPAVLAEACASHGLQFLSFSSDLVFDGEAGQPYRESDEPLPLNVYGSSKAEAEQLILQAFPAALVVRTSAFFGPWDNANFPMKVRAAAQAGEPMAVPADMIISPTFVPDLVHTCLDLLIDGSSGIWHLANQGEVSWYDFARRILVESGMTDSILQPAPIAELDLPARRPRYAALDSERARLLPELEDALQRYLH